MDPDECLERLLETARFVLGGEAGDMFEESAEELAQQLLSLDEWLRKGGFLPAIWNGRGSKRSRQEREAGQTLQAIHANMDGKEWSPDTLDAIAEILRGAGFTIREPADRGE